jgi:hypothetical protein
MMDTVVGTAGPICSRECNAGRCFGQPASENGRTWHRNEMTNIPQDVDFH